MKGVPSDPSPAPPPVSGKLLAGWSCAASKMLLHSIESVTVLGFPRCPGNISLKILDA